ncbi:MAG: histidine kinase [Oscillospiraceae bacterium]
MAQPKMNRFRFRDMPIRRKLLVITLLVALLISAVALGGFQLVTRNSNRMIYTQTAGSMRVISDKIAARLDSLMEVSLYIAVNREFQANLTTINEQPLTAAQGVARSEITTLLSQTFQSDLVAITILPLDATPIVIGSNSSAENDEVLARALAMAAEAKGAPVWLPTGRSDGSVLCAREIRNVRRPFLEPMGVIILRVNLDKIARESAANILTGEYNIAINQEGELLYPYAEDGQSVFDESVFHDESLYTIGRRGGDMRFVTRSTISAFRLEWSLVLGIPYEDVFYSLIVANILFVVCLAAAVVIAMLLSRRMLGSINQNVHLLTDKMNRVREGDLEPYSGTTAVGEDELGVLNRHFDKMTADFRQVIEDNYVKELLLTQTQLKALEQQINPHFLYNSLESINWFARRGEGKNVSAIAQALGSLLRSTLSENEDRIPLRRELAILDSYLRIQRIRFPDTLRVHTQADEDEMDALVPKMSIQPLVENAIVHSLEENIGECHIYIRVALEGEMVRVEVENDGSEIDVDILDKLRQKTASPKGHGIGLINIDSRIKLLFGQEYGLKLKSAEDRVTVSFRIPAKETDAVEKRGKANAESADS